MAVNIYNDSIGGCYIGNDVVSAIYQGNKKLYPTHKFRATYLSGETMAIDCDNDTTLTTAVTRNNTAAHYTFMTSAEIGGCINTIGEFCFSYMQYLSSITMSDSVETLSSYALMVGAYKPVELKLSKNIKYIGANGLNGIRVNTSLEFPNLVSAGDYFLWVSNHNSLENVVIGDKITTIGNSFLYTDNSAYDFNVLKTLTIYATTPPTLGSNAFVNNNANLTIYVPAESVNAYKTATNWSNFASKIQPITN